MESGNFPKLDTVIKNHVMAALDLAGGNKAKAAELLGVSVKTVYNHYNRYKMEDTQAEQSQAQPVQSSGSEQVSVEENSLPTGNNSGSSIFG